jgi:site-specific DNA-methyltransferase (adenine-specific)
VGDVVQVSLYNDDCLNVLSTLPDGSVDLVATDCPYHIIPGGCTNKGKGNGIFQKEIASDGKLFTHNDIEFSEWLPEVYRVLKFGTHCYIFCNGRNLMRLQIEAEKVGFSYQNTLVWDKGNVTPNRYYMGACEFVLMLKKGKSRTINDRGCPNVLRVQNRIGKKHHPTEKPIDLMKILVENSTQPNDLVLDPFMGSGSTGVACVNTNRNFIGMELDKRYFEIATARINKAKSDRLDNLLGGVECK